VTSIPEPISQLTIVAGGTGGHFFPALAIAREYRRRGGTVRFMVAGQHQAEHLRLAAEHGFAAVGVEAVRLPKGVAETWLFPWQMMAACWKVRQLLKANPVSAVLGMGSFVALPVCLAAVSLRIPLYLHEGNAIPGLVNRLMSRLARSIALSLPLAPGQKCHCPQVHTGMPLREALVESAGASTAAGQAAESAAEPESRRRTLLVFGGSQGARFLNQTMMQTAGVLEPASCRRLRVIHLSGREDNTALQAAYDSAGIEAVVRKSESQMQECYEQADLVLSRAGASTVCELALFRKPALLVPLPHAADDHQSGNARVVVAAGTGMLLPQAELSPSALAKILQDWLQGSPQMQQAFPGPGLPPCPRAAAAVVDMIAGERQALASGEPHA
jgi:UDP-N-acetylglucosamine--N-acetylmuramyl-(pentapeptide) pyrophosphoryl-undecaprenol N-acetylglucosamine transferase